jgi:GNAT superfamily N-acetyltransferase
MSVPPDMPTQEPAQPALSFLSLYLDDPQRATEWPPPPLPAGVDLHLVDAAHLAASESASLRGALAALYNTAFELPAHSPEALDADSLAQWQQHPLFRPAGIILAHRGQELIGAAVGTLSLMVPGEPSQHGAIELVIVHPQHQGQGLGTRLLHEVIVWLTSQVVPCIVVSTDNPALARALLRYGFVSHARGCGPD